MNEWRRPSVISDEYEQLHQHAESMRDYADRRLLKTQEVEQFPLAVRYGKREVAFSWAGAFLLFLCALVGGLFWWKI